MRVVSLLILSLALLSTPLSAATVAAEEGSAREATGIAGSRRTQSDWRMAPNENAGSTFLAMSQGLAACLAVLAAGVYLYRRFNPQAVMNAKRRMQIRERLPLGARAHLMLVQIDHREVLVALSGDQIAIHESPTAPTFDSLLPMDSGCIDEEQLPA